MPLKPHPTDPDKMVYVSRQYDLPQRTWVGLTKEEIAEFDTWHDNKEEEKGWVAPSEIVAYISEKLRSKNT